MWPVDSNAPPLSVLRVPVYSVPQHEASPKPSEKPYTFSLPFSSQARLGLHRPWDSLASILSLPSVSTSWHSVIAHPHLGIQPPHLLSVPLVSSLSYLLKRQKYFDSWSKKVWRGWGYSLAWAHSDSEVSIPVSSTFFDSQSLKWSWTLSLVTHAEGLKDCVCLLKTCLDRFV